MNGLHAHRAALLPSVLRDPAQVQHLSLAEWDVFVRQGRQANLLARVWHMLSQRGLLDTVPARPRAHLEWAQVSAARQLIGVEAEVSAIQQALQGIPVILLKGAAYTLARLPAAAGRIFSDIDVMVPRESLDAAEAALLGHGWIATHTDPYDQRYYREWMHELPPLMHGGRGTHIDVHHAILPLTMAVHPDPAKLRAAAVAVPCHPNLKVLAPEDMVLHSAAHLFYDGEFNNGLRDLCDLDVLLRHFANARPAFWSALVARAEALQLTRSLYYALRYVGWLLATPIPPEAIAAAEIGAPSRTLLAVMDALFMRALLPDHVSCNDRYSHLARRALYIRANWLRMPPLMLAQHLFHKAFLSPRA